MPTSFEWSVGQLSREALDEPQAPSGLPQPPRDGAPEHDVGSTIRCGIVRRKRDEARNGRNSEPHRHATPVDGRRSRHRSSNRWPAGHARSTARDAISAEPNVTMIAILFVTSELRPSMIAVMPRFEHAGEMAGFSGQERAVLSRCRAGICLRWAIHGINVTAQVWVASELFALVWPGMVVRKEAGEMPRVILDEGTEVRFDRETRHAHGIDKLSSATACRAVGRAFCPNCCTTTCVDQGRSMPRTLIVGGRHAIDQPAHPTCTNGTVRTRLISTQPVCWPTARQTNDSARQIATVDGDAPSL